MHNQLYDEINKVKDDLTSYGDLTSDDKYHNWVVEQRNKLYFNKTSFIKDSVNYDVKCDPQSYLQALFYISKTLETMNETIKYNNQINGSDTKLIRLFNVMPLRTNIVPKNICLDTGGLISTFIKEGAKKQFKTFKEDNNQYDLWNKFFHLEKRVFKKGNKYKFNFMIRTDGISCSVVFKKINDNGKFVGKKYSQCTENFNPSYIEDTFITEDLRNSKIVCADPGKSDLIYCGSKDEYGDLQTFRYTQNQRMVEIGTKKYNKKMHDLSKETKINDLSIKEIETQLSFCNSKTCNYVKFINYCKEKNKLNNLLFNYYKQQLFRKLKLNRFTNTQKSEAKMIKNFKKKFGPPEKTVFIIGDYDNGNHHMKGVEPTMCKKFRRIFKNEGYKTYLIDEFRTSKLCNNCHSDLQKFLERLSKKSKYRDQYKYEICHGLLRCQSVTHNCKIIHNRDKNAVQNMLNIVKSIFETGERPNVFCKGKSIIVQQDNL